MKDSFSSFHPFIHFSYFTIMIVFNMFFTHPVFQTISFIGAVVYSIQLKGRKGARFNLLYMLPLLIVMAAMNPMFNHAGVTILFYLHNGNPVTLESILFGISSAFMFVSVIIWFSCYNVVMTSDKLIFLFGKLFPALSLIFSMVMRFVPRYAAQIKVISNAQKCIGRDISQGSLLQRARNGIKILSILATWALENSIETADSMKSRGYGLPNRTSFSLFRFDHRDKLASGILFGLMAIVMTGAVMGVNTMRFFPSIKVAGFTPYSAVVYVSYMALCFLPVFINFMGALKWKLIESRI